MIGIDGEFTSRGQINRVELIDYRSSTSEPGRVFSAMDMELVALSIQDDGRTLKLFIS
jgi:hypothetical protein